MCLSSPWESHTEFNAVLYGVCMDFFIEVELFGVTALKLLFPGVSF